MIRAATPADFGRIHEIINDAAQAYRGVIPADRWHDPYMPREELRGQIADGVEFLCFEDGAAGDGGEVIGVMGLQDRGEVHLIRHAYVATSHRNGGVGSRLLRELLDSSSKPVLIGTWAAATWAIAFYRKHGFSVVSEADKDRLLRTYWSIPERQVDTSVVLADRRWLEAQARP